jgi:hypothetical protein
MNIKSKKYELKKISANNQAKPAAAAPAAAPAVAQQPVMMHPGGSAPMVAPAGMQPGQVGPPIL